MMVTWKQYLVLMSFTSKKEMILVRRAPNLQLLLLKLPHIGAILQRPTQLGKLPIVVQATEEKIIPPPCKNREIPQAPSKKEEEEEHHIENDINNFSLEDMEIEVVIEKIFPTIDQTGNMAHQNSSLEIIENETFNEEDSFAF
jgi:hypothetical protein